MVDVSNPRRLDQGLAHLAWLISDVDIGVYAVLPACSHNGVHLSVYHYTA